MGLSRRIMQFRRCALTPSNLSLVLVFALAYVTVRAYVLKIMRQHRAIVYQLEPPEVPYQNAGRFFSQVKFKTSYRDCPISSLAQRSIIKSQLPPGDLQESFLYGSCRRVSPVPRSCDVAEKIFFSSPPDSCASESSINFCKVLGSPAVGWRVVCNETAAKACLSELFVGVTNQATGALDWTQVKSVFKLSDMLNKMLHRPVNLKHFGFAFIKCIVKQASVTFEDHVTLEEYYEGKNSESSAEDIFSEQLLILPPYFTKTSFLEKEDFRNVININIVFIDSVSHQHFFRSLNASVQVLEKIETSSHPVASVFDFELVQAIKSRTYENLQAVFGGIVDTTTESFGTQSLPPEPLKLEALLAGFKQRRYKTLWLEDLCHTWEWGLSKDLHFMNMDDIVDKEFWDYMWQKLSQAEIDDLGPTLAMCRVLQANHVKDHFHGPDAVCFNGRHQHEYLLDYLLMYQQTAYAARQPTFTFTQTNVAHEDSGRRIQTLDQALASYIESVSRLSNTLTIILSDHGNTYGAFLKNSEEAQIEIYHPAMFFIVPNRVSRILGKDAMHTLKVNTKRLVSLLDLHKTLLYLQNPKRRSSATLNLPDQGLFSPVNTNRTCNDIPRIKPNLCICENFETPVRNDVDYNLLAYFAVGRLNDEIQRQALKSFSRSAKESSKQKSLSMVAFRNCEKLILKGVENIKESQEKDGSVNIKMELLVQKSQVFLVSLLMQPKQVKNYGNHGSRLKLQTYERLSSYGEFTRCAEEDVVWPSLCVCEQMNPNLAIVNGSEHLKSDDIHVRDGDGHIGDELGLNLKTNKRSFNDTIDIDINATFSKMLGRGVEKSSCHTTVSRVSSFQVDIGQAVFDLMGNLADGRHAPDMVQTK
ncbi:hypothetical protein ElyMa_006292700 [Elysia marginata]|uniref:Sulfatase N-terminal domain-containing protein n=1 Tax=Elysia marginata TaxID=1093978 RepID=A0AAV4HDG4_9GAST|nr:hypothetical protein ElyMa_006292700 [Elysia marginata]